MISVFSVILRYILTSELDVHYTKSWQARRPQPSATLWQEQPCPAAAPCPGPLRALRGFLGGIFPAPQGKALPRALLLTGTGCGLGACPQPPAGASRPAALRLEPV